jgi:hypothetical protein
MKQKPIYFLYNIYKWQRKVKGCAVILTKKEELFAVQNVVGVTADLVKKPELFAKHVK